MIGCNGVMNRIAEDGVLLDWFRKPQKRFGTTTAISSDRGAADRDDPI